MNKEKFLTLPIGDDGRKVAIKPYEDDYLLLFSRPVLDDELDEMTDLISNKQINGELLKQEGKYHYVNSLRLSKEALLTLAELITLFEATDFKTDFTGEIYTKSFSVKFNP